jgi:hypothetical protein
MLADAMLRLPAAIIGREPLDTSESEGRPAVIKRKRHSLFARFLIANRVRRSLTSSTRFNELERFKRGVSGTLPQPGEGGVIVAACDDYYYKHFAITLVLSMELLETAQRLHLHLCAPSLQAVTHIEQMSRSLRYVSLTWTVDDCNLAEGLPYKTIYYAASRFLIAPAVIEAAGAPVLCIDIDGIAIQKIWPAYEPVRRDADVLVTRRPEQEKPWRKILAGAIGLNPTSEGTRFAANLSRALASVLDLRPSYHIDQIVFHYLMIATSRRTSLMVKDMPKKFIDFDFANDSVIWTAQAWRGKDSDRYKNARREVLQRFPDLANVSRVVEP